MKQIFFNLQLWHKPRHTISLCFQHGFFISKCPNFVLSTRRKKLIDLKQPIRMQKNNNFVFFSRKRFSGQYACAQWTQFCRTSVWVSGMSNQCQFLSLCWVPRRTVCLCESRMAFQNLQRVSYLSFCEAISFLKLLLNETLLLFDAIRLPFLTFIDNQCRSRLARLLPYSFITACHFSMCYFSILITKVAFLKSLENRFRRCLQMLTKVQISINVEVILRQNTSLL